MNQNLNKIIDKIKKLLSLGNSPNKEEAQAAIFKAQELIEKYNIEEGLLEDVDNKIVEWTYIDGFNIQGIPYYEKSLWSISCHLFDCYGIQTFQFGFYQLKIIGPQVQIESVKLVLNLLELSIANEVKELKRKLHYAGPTTVGTFKAGIAKTLCEKAQEVMDERKKNRQEYQNKYGIVLASTLVVDNYIKEHYPNIGKGTVPTAGVDMGDAFNAGKAAGEGISLNVNKPVKQGNLLK